LPALVAPIVTPLVPLSKAPAIFLMSFYFFTN
jgi:hypothetical protein